MSEAHLKTKVSTDISELEKQMKEAANAAQETAKQFSELKEKGMQLLEMVGVIEALKTGFEKFKGVVEAGEALENLSTRTGIAVNELVKLQMAFQFAGLGGEAVAGSVAKMQRAIVEAASKGSSSFTQLGLSARELSKETPDEQFKEIGEHIKAISNPAQQAAAAMSIFGREGAQLLTVFKGDALEEAAGWLGKIPEVMETYGPTFQAVADEMEGIGKKFEGFWDGFAAPIAQVLRPVLEEFKTLDLTTFGQNLGTVVAEPINFLYNAFKADKLGSAFGEALEFGAAVGVNKLLTGIEIVENVLGGIWQQELDVSKDAKWVGAFSEVVTGAAGAFGAGMMEAVRIPIEFVQWGLAKAVGYLEQGLLQAVKALVDVVTALGTSVNYLTGSKLIDVDNLNKGFQVVQGAAQPVIDHDTKSSFQQFQGENQKDWLLGTNPGDIAQKAGQIFFDGLKIATPLVQSFSDRLKDAVINTKAVHTYDDDPTHYGTIGDAALYKMPALKQSESGGAGGEGSGAQFNAGNGLKGIVADGTGGFRVFGGAAQSQAVSFGPSGVGQVAAAQYNAQQAANDPTSLLKGIADYVKSIDKTTTDAWA